MAGIYCADIYCDDCIEDIKNRIAKELWGMPDMGAPADILTPDGRAFISNFRKLDQLVGYLDSMDERDYDSGDYPKYCSDDEESDGPEHCGSHDDCLNPTICPDGSEVSHCFGNSLTSYGEENLKEMVREGGSVADLWREVYDWVDFENQCENCGDDCGSDYVCTDCEESQCVNCGDFTTQPADLDCNGCCENCACEGIEE